MVPLNNVCVRFAFSPKIVPERRIAREHRGLPPVMGDRAARAAKSAYNDTRRAPRRAARRTADSLSTMSAAARRGRDTSLSARLSTCTTPRSRPARRWRSPRERTPSRGRSRRCSAARRVRRGSGTSLVAQPLPQAGIVAPPAQETEVRAIERGRGVRSHQRSFDQKRS